MRFRLIALSLFLFAAPALAAKPARIDVPTDPKAKYTVVDLKNVGGGKAEITTRRDGPSGTSYAKRLVDCASMRFKYVGDGDTMVEMNRSKPSPTMGPLVTGSISYYVSRFACRAIGQ